MVEIVALGNLLNKSIYVQKGDALERLHEVDSIIFDKTGTLTFGQPKFINHNDFTKKDKNILASMAAHSQHLLCQSISANLPNEAILNFKVAEEKGQGLKAQYHNDVYLLGSAKWCQAKASKSKEQYMTIWFRKNNASAKKLLFLDQLRPEANEVISELQKHYDVYMLSGDTKENVEEIANRLNVKNFAATQTYEYKYKFLQELHEQGKKTLMIGDGLNDAVALKYACCSMSPKTALSISKDAADFIYNGDLNYVLYILIQAKKSIRTVKQNFLISLIYNLAVAPIAFLGYANPIIAAIAMSISSLTVIVNSWFLRQR
jgi:Cu2+-exporting ATPase